MKFWNQVWISTEGVNFKLMLLRKKHEFTILSLTISHYDKMFHHWHAMIADRNKNEWMITGAYHFHISTLLVVVILAN